MSLRLVAVVGSLVIVGSSAVGCSSAPTSAPVRGSISGGTAEVTVNGQKLATLNAVDCTFIESITTIKTGDDVGGATVVIDNSGKLDAKSVDIRNLGGFTGGYWQNLGHDATVSLTGRTFTITGTADGFNAANPSARVSGPFSIKASC